MNFIKKNIQKIFLGVIIIIVVAVVALRGDQLVELVETMKGATILPLVFAIVSQLFKYFAQSFAYSFSFHAVGERMRARDMLPLVFGTFFVNTIAPSMNLAGTALVVDDARHRGIDPGKSTSAALLMQITIDGAFTTVMIAAFTLLLLTVGLNPLWILMGSVVVVLVGTMITVLVLSSKKPELLVNFLLKIESLVNKFIGIFKRKPLKPWARRIAGSFSEAGNLVGQNWKYVIFAYLCSLFASCCELICFALCGLGFQIHAAEPLICGYVVATLFAMISITPQGVGVVEAMVILAFTLYGQNEAAGAATAIVYRGIVFWMPFVIGAILMTQTQVLKGSAKKSVNKAADAQEKLINEREVPIRDYDKHQPTPDREANLSDFKKSPQVSINEDECSVGENMDAFDNQEQNSKNEKQSVSDKSKSTK